MIGSIGAIANGFSRFIGGILYDKIGFKKLVGVTMIFIIILMSTLSLISNVYVFGIWIVALFIA